MCYTRTMETNTAKTYSDHIRVRCGGDFKSTFETHQSESHYMRLATALRSLGLHDETPTVENFMPAWRLWQVDRERTIPLIEVLSSVLFDHNTPGDIILAALRAGGFDYRHFVNHPNCPTDAIDDVITKRLVDDYRVALSARCASASQRDALRALIKGL